MKSLSGKFYKGAPQPAQPQATNTQFNEQPTSVLPSPPVPKTSRSNSINSAPSEVGESNKDPFEDAFNSLSSSSRASSATPSPTPSSPQQEKVQQEKTGARPAKKPLVLKKTVPKKDPFDVEGWNDLDMSSASLKPAKIEASTKPVPPPTTNASIKPRTFEAEKMNDNESDGEGDWDTKW